MTERTESVVREPDEISAPAVIFYIGCVIALIFAIIAWVYYFRGYA